MWPPRSQPSQGSAGVGALGAWSHRFSSEYQSRAHRTRAYRAAGAVRQGDLAVGNLHRGMRLASKLAHGLDDLGHPAAVSRMIAAQSTAVGVERQGAIGRTQRPARHELTAPALGYEAEVFQREKDGDRERVVDG